MVLTDNISDNSRRLLIGFIPIIIELIHGIEDAAVDWLQTIPHIRKRAANDHAHGVVHIGLFHFIFDIDKDIFWDHGQRCS